MKVKIFSKSNIDALEEAINQWLSENHQMEIKDIKFTDTWCWNGDPHDSGGWVSAMIIYKERMAYGGAGGGVNGGGGGHG